MPPPRAAAVVNATRHIWAGGFQVALAVKNPSANAGDVRDVGSIPGSRRSPGGGHGNPLQCSCLENSHELFLLLRMQSPISKGPGGKKDLKEQSRKKLPSFICLYN